MDIEAPIQTKEDFQDLLNYLAEQKHEVITFPDDLPFSSTRQHLPLIRKSSPSTN